VIFGGLDIALPKDRYHSFQCARAKKRFRRRGKCSIRKFVRSFEIPLGQVTEAEIVKGTTFLRVQRHRFSKFVVDSDHFPAALNGADRMKAWAS